VPACWADRQRTGRLDAASSLHALFWIPRSSRGMTNNRTFITPASIVTDCFGANAPRNDKERVMTIEYSRIGFCLKLILREGFNLLD